METIRIVRNVFLRTFLVSAGVGLFFVVLTFAGWNVWMPLGERLFHTDEATITTVTIQFFVALRFFLWFCLLAPAVAMHWTLKAEARQSR